MTTVYQEKKDAAANAAHLAALADQDTRCLMDDAKHGLRGSRTNSPDTKRAFYRNPDDSRHGSTNGYNNLGCRCQRCKDAWAADHLRYMDAHPEQREKSNVRERELTALKNGYASREEYEDTRARRSARYVVRCPFCSWVSDELLPFQVGNRNGFHSHVRAAHPPIIEAVPSREL